MDGPGYDLSDDGASELCFGDTEGNVVDIEALSSINTTSPPAASVLE